jgi:DNA-binding NtrC family response regulator
MNRRTVLVIEDDPRSLFALESVLQARGYAVTGHPNAEQARACNGHPYDVAIIDVRLPGEQGPEYARSLHAKHPETRIIFVTAYNGVSEIGATVPGAIVLIKPIDMDTLTKLL